MAETARILIIEDDEAIASTVSRALSSEGYEVAAVGDGEEGLERARRERPDLLLLDLGLPGRDGLELARELRSGGEKMPILILTARDEIESRVAGLDAGADDYLVKPFAGAELLARVRALLRRQPPSETAPLVVGDLSLDPVSYEARRGGRRLRLTRREFELLAYLMRHEREVTSREQLLREVWGTDPLWNTNTIEVFISTLRRKLEAAGEPRLLHTVRGAGYVVRAD